MKDLNYRKDIDGLRAIAVLTVVLFHLDINGFSGGFVGVDIFFVISGYLITGIIQKQINKGNFSFSNFYQRRIQRILPLYYLVGFSSLFAAFFILLPSDFESFTSSFVAASVYLSNIYFWQDASGYFGLNSEQIPLLHTWSLSVEEQFYIFWPLTLFFLMSKFNRFYLLIITILLMVLSLSISEWAAVEGKSYAYFLLHTRAFELLICHSAPQFRIKVAH